jgi:aryl-alcohol dehydrogenase-like predicted oxidoreductase
MEYRQLGRSGLRVSTITLGTMGFGGTGWASPVGRIDVEGARHQIALARDAGVNLFDTADVYSEGLSEQILGEALGKDRDDVLIATKVRGDMGPGPNDGGLSRHHIVRACEASLQRLNTDHIDLYQVHEWDGLTPLDETLSALDDLVRSGKVRYVGSSNYTARQLMKALWISDRDGLEPFVSQQIYYSLQARDAENELVPIAVEEGLGVLVWSPLAGGLLSGKYRRGQAAPEGTRRFEGWTEPPVHDEDRLYDTIDALVEIGEAHDVSAAQVALAYTLAQQAVTSVIVGARTEDQLRDNLAAADLALTADELRRLEEVSRVPLLYPYWHQANTGVDRLSAADLSLLAPHLPPG